MSSSSSSPVIIGGGGALSSAALTPTPTPTPSSSSSSSRYAVFDGSTDFQLWRARVENELLRFHLLGYIRVRNYDGSQAFKYNGEEVPPKCALVPADASVVIKDEPAAVVIGTGGGVGDAPSAAGKKRARVEPHLQQGRLTRLQVIAERAEAMGILQRYLHPEVERAILGKNIFDSWETLCGMYGNRNVSDFYKVHRLLHAMRLGEKLESAQDFITRLELMMAQYAQIAGVPLTDPFRSMVLAHALPPDWAPMLEVWKAFKPYIPYVQLVEKVAFEHSSRLVLKERDDALAKAKPEAEKATTPKSSDAKGVSNRQTSSSSTKPSSSSSAATKELSSSSKEKSKTSSSSTRVGDKYDNDKSESSKQKERRDDDKRSSHYDKRDDKKDDRRSDKHYDSKRSDDRSYDKKREDDKRDDDRREYKKEDRRDKEHYHSSTSYDKRDAGYSSSSYRDKQSYSSSSNGTPYEKRMVCFYCLKIGHCFQACWFLRVDVENDSYANPHKKYSATVSNERTAYMVQRIEQYVKEMRRDKPISELAPQPYVDHRALRSKSSFREESALGYGREASHHDAHAQEAQMTPRSSYSQVASMRSQSIFRETIPLQQQQQQQQQYDYDESARLDTDVERYKKRSRSVFGSESTLPEASRPHDPRSRSVFRQPETSGYRTADPNRRSVSPLPSRSYSAPRTPPATIQRLKDIKKEKSSVMWRHNSSASLGAAAASADGDGDVLPAGWTRKESKTQKGRYYYISPAGKTQWTPPNARTTASAAGSGSAAATATDPTAAATGTATAAATGTTTAATAATATATAAPPAPPRAPPVVLASYNWVTEVEIEFGEGRLGVSLREVRQFDTTPHPLFQAEVDDLPKINGKAGPAELYNWSVKPHKRLTIGMRVTGIEDQGLAGLTYKEVVDRLKKAPRPLRIRFADVERGTVEDNPQLALISEQEARESDKSSAYLQQKQEFTRVLVTSELHTELWTIETNKLLRSMTVMKKKWDTVSSEFDVLNERRLELRKENERLVGEKLKFDTMIKHLKLQEIHAMENPELVKANELAKRNAGLTEDITKMSAGNKRLRKERVALQSTLDELEGSLAKLDAKAADEDDGKGGDDEMFFGIDLTAPPREQLAALKKKLRRMDEELSKEQRKATKVQREMDQLNKHLASLSSSKSRRSEDREPSGSSSASSASATSASKSVSSAGASGSKSPPPEIARLEAKILELRKQQRSVVETMSKAAQVGDQDLAKECQRRRHAIKEELKHAQDELHKLKVESGGGGGGGATSAGSKSSSSSAAAAAPSSSGSLSRTRKHSTAPQPTTSAAATRGSNSSSNGASQPKEPRAKKADKMPTLVGFLDKGPTEWSERGLISNMKTMRGARERWCEITPDGFLKYYKRRGDPVVRGEIDLSDKSLEVVCEDAKRGREFVLSTSTQQSHFFTKSTPELEKWVKTLRAANAFLVTTKQLEALAKKVEAADKRNGGGGSAFSRAAQRAMEESYPEEDEQFYGRATLGF